MARTARKVTKKTATTKSRSGLTKAKVKRVARNAKASLDTAAHEAGLAVRRTARKVETKVEEAKGPAEKRARRAKRTVASALESAGDSITAAIAKARSRLGR